MSLQMDFLKPDIFVHFVRLVYFSSGSVNLKESAESMYWKTSQISRRLC